MDKRERVIKELEEVIAEAVYPFRPRKFMMPMELAEDAIALLKAQEATINDLYTRYEVLCKKNPREVRKRRCLRPVPI